MSNFEDAAKKDLEKREFPPIPEQNVESNEKVTSLGKASMFDGPETDEPVLLPGYHEIWSENFPSKGIFYASNTRFFIRPAEVKEIRHFSTIDEQNPFSVDEALNEILKSCLMIRQPNKQMSFKDLKEEDRIHVILSIRELTFSKGENQLAIKHTCEECGHDNEIKIENRSFQSNDLDPKIMKYFDEESRIFHVQTKSNGIIKMSPPSIGTMMEITKYIQKKQQENKKIDQSFIKVLPYLVQEWRGFTESTISNLEVEFLQWSSSKYQTMYMLSDMCRVGVKEKLYSTCEKCHSGLESPITFPGGIKSLFVVSDLSGELL